MRAVGGIRRRGPMKVRGTTPGNWMWSKKEMEVQDLYSKS